MRQIDRALFAYHKINTGQSGQCSNDRQTRSTGSRLEGTIPEIIEAICEDLGAGGKEIRRKDIVERAEDRGINKSSVLPADYCDNTKTGRWSEHSFLHSIGRGKYILSKFIGLLG